MSRLQALIQAEQSELDFLWEIRQRDFYGDTSLGSPREMPTAGQVRKALALARSLVDRIGQALRE